MSNNIEGTGRPRRRNPYGENVVSVRSLSPKLEKQQTQKPTRERPWWEKEDRIKRTNVIIPDFLKTGTLPPVPERTDIPDLDFSTSETILQEAYDHKLFRDNPNILVIRNPETGSFVYSATDGHVKTSASQRTIKRSQLPDHRRDQLVLKDIGNFLQKANENNQLLIPNFLKIDLAKIGEQLEDLSQMAPSTLAEKSYAQMMGSGRLKGAKGKVFMSIGAGLDESIFLLEELHAKTILAIDPVYISLERMQEGGRVHVADMAKFEDVEVEGELKKGRFPEDVLRKHYRKHTVQATEDAINNFFARHIDSNVHFIPGSAHALPIRSRFADVIYSSRCISAMSSHYDVMALSILEAIRVLKKNGTLIISPWDRKGLSFVGTQVDIIESLLAWPTNKKRVELLLKSLDIDLAEIDGNEEGDRMSKIEVKHTSKSFRRFQNYDALLQAVTKQN